jgi:nicotinamide-nucleotide amidase
MKKTLLVIGERYRIVNEAGELVKRKAEAMLGLIDIIMYLRESDPDILFEIQNLIELSETLVIACSKSYMPLISKTLATHCGDNLVVKNDSLMPSRANLIGKNDYSIILGATEIVVSLVDDKSEPISLSEQTGRFCIFGQDEESVRLLTTPLAQAHDVTFSAYERCGGWIQGIAEAKRYGNLEAFLQNTQKLFGDNFIKSEDAAYAVLKMLEDETLAVAESCTGGLLAYKFTSIAGASKNFIGGFVTYANEAKSAWLGVLPTTIEEFGAVSEQTIEQMLDGTLKASGADYALATSGIAGPDGGTQEKPVGTVYIGMAKKYGEKNIQKLQLSGNRLQIQSCASWQAIKLLAEFLIKSKKGLDN